MAENKITYEDIKRYEFVLGKVPSLLLGTMIRRNSNLVGKFESTITKNLSSLNEVQQKQLDTVLNSDISDLQNVLRDAYEKSGKKQYKQLSEPKAAKFIENNLKELEKLIKK
ncbi:MAG: hypothetical protein IJI98_06470 [Methanosphaera sp.]|uniref:hypothetical protein n=1 Tax=Methanosphaera sp. ISO3-F5 TaxID=1452353 RepID=UPI002B25B2DC|nr:hypothetical protein [Methanosphaera sp. ISO3-F5]MBR0472328.1 hypothetical protein [Methanosphaera sp.]WQH64685.1 hypothetical protein PXD04_02495 [Methanosphaera sp. ISO3-F5]